MIMIKTVAEKLNKIKKERYIIAVDGRCGAGKTTFAQRLCKHFDCSVIHMDDFFLRPEQRTSERLNEPGGNIDYERFAAEIIVPLQNGGSFRYRPFRCQTLSFDEEKTVENKKIILVEGAYSCHPAFSDIYDLKIFLDIDATEQLKRIEKRNGKQMLNQFKNKWIPLEERYFKAFNIKEKCDICF